MQHIGLRMKIGLGFGASIILSLALGLIAVEKMSAVDNKSIILTQEFAPEVDVANNLERLALKTMYNMRGYALTGEKSYLRESEKELNEAEKYLNDALVLGARSPNLVKLRENSALLSSTMREYKGLADKTIALNESISDDHVLMDKAAKTFLDSCLAYLSGQTKTREEQIATGSGTMGLREQLRKITRINEIIDLGNNVRIDNFKSQALRNPIIMQNALARFDEMYTKLDELRDSTQQDMNLRDIAATKEAARQYKSTMEDLLSNWLALQDVSNKREAVAANVLEIAQATSKAGIANTLAIANEAESTLSTASTVVIVGLVAASLLGLVVAFSISRIITRPLVAIVGAMEEIAEGDFRREVDFRSKDEVGVLADAFRKIQKSLREKTTQAEAIAAGDFSHTSLMAGERDTLGAALSRMTASLRQFKLQNERSDWIKSGLNMLSAKLTGETDSKRLADTMLRFLASYLGAQIATLYLADDAGTLALQGSYAVGKQGSLADDAFKPGEGLAGQAFLEKDLILTTDIPDDYLRISSSFGESSPRNILALPFTREDKAIGVMELGSFEAFSEMKIAFLRLASESLTVAFDSIQKQAKVRELLERTQTQASQLLDQQEELKSVNEELEEHTQALRRSEENLRQQQEELQALNEELEEKNSALEQQTDMILQKNQDLEEVQRDIERKAAELEITSRYKSEFLANMSHELRTPLNSLLLLSRSLRDNGAGHLSSDEVEAAGIIFKNGKDLLNLINDILDISKIEAGKMSMNLEAVQLDVVTEHLKMDFQHQAEQKGLRLQVEVEEGLPVSILTDAQRLEQILRNLLSNAMKFTEQGAITVRIHRPDLAVEPGRTRLDPSQSIAFTIADTGIGIPADKHRDIFEAFQQVDGSTSRKYGGTGLGLSITRELIWLLGGEIALASELGVGTTFTVTLPVAGPVPMAGAADAGQSSLGPIAQPGRPSVGQAAPAPVSVVSRIPDDRKDVTQEDKAVLIIEDDPDFAKILYNLCHDKGFKALAAATGEEGLALVEQYLPTAVILDIRLPGINGWTVLNSLKKSPVTRHIPVHVISVHDALHDALTMGAIGFLTKPVDREDLDTAIVRIEAMVEKKVKDLLLVEDNADLRKSIKALVGDLGVNVIEVEGGHQALEALRKQRFDCMILDIGLQDMNGFELLKRLENERETGIPPVIVYTGKELTKNEERELRKHAESIIIKGARSEERLLDEVTLFLHRMVSALPQSKQRMIINLHNRDAMLEGKKILIVDDDMRNLFAVSRILEEKGLHVLKAEDGVKALEILESIPEVDLVLLDIMMPVMDGYQTLKKIREQSRFTHLPVIALTAKAMKEDREKCIVAGANDYLSKPVDVDKLLSMMRVWLYGK